MNYRKTSFICAAAIARAVSLICIGLFSLQSSAYAADSLGVGWRGSIARWNQGVAEASLVAISPDSIWTWDVQPNGNLAPGTLERGGSALTPGNSVATFISGAEVMYDGADSTAFNPDDFADRFGLQRTSAIYIDLGSTFRVNRIRLYPRQDTEHKALFPRAFSLSTNGGVDEDGNLLACRRR